MRRFARSKFSRRNTRSPPMSGASPATTSCAATRCRSSAGTGCIPARSRTAPYVVTALGKAAGPIIAASDYMKSMPDNLAPWLGSRLVSLGTDGFGRSDNREHLRRHFEVDAESIVASTLSKLAREGVIKAEVAEKAFAELGLSTEGAGSALA